jgi:hypothetical protein
MDSTYESTQMIDEKEQLVDMLLEKYISLTKIEAD